jgi:hypothetical protein
MKSLFFRSIVITGLLSLLWLGCPAASAQDVPDFKKMKESLDQLRNQQSGCPDFMKAMVPAGGKVILCDFHPTMVNTTMEMKAEAGKSPRYGEPYQFEFKITYFDPKMGFWGMQKDDVTRQENARADDQIEHQRQAAADKSAGADGPVEFQALTDGTGKAWYQKHVIGEDNVLGTSKAPLEDIYSCDYLVIQDNGLIINFHATAGSKGMADGWLQNIRGKLATQGY